MSRGTWLLARVIVATMAVLGGCSLSSCSDMTTTPAREFVCYTDGALTERHVGVLGARLVFGGSLWAIHYVDGPVMYYSPLRGEACGIEEL